MKLPLPNVLIPILAVIVVVATTETALARTKKHRVEHPPQPALTQEEARHPNHHAGSTVAKTASPDLGSAKGTGGAPADHSARQQHLYAAGPRAQRAGGNRVPALPWVSTNRRQSIASATA